MKILAFNNISSVTLSGKSASQVILCQRLSCNTVIQNYQKKNPQTVFYLNKFDSLWLKVDIGEIKVVIMEKILIVRIISRSNVFRQILIFFFYWNPWPYPLAMCICIYFLSSMFIHICFSLSCLIAVFSIAYDKNGLFGLSLRLKFT